MDDKQRVAQRVKRQKSKKRRKAGKAFLLVLSILVLAVSAFFITVKIFEPDFEIKSILPKEKIQQAVNFVKEDVFKQTTAKPLPSATEKPELYDYEQFSDFAFNTALQGNQVGNLLNKTQGSVTYSSSHIFYSIDGDGIYSFEPVDEINSKVNVNKLNLKYLNVLGDYIYFVDTSSNMLKRCAQKGGDEKVIAENIRFAYVYNDKIYYIGTDNTIGYINVSDFQKKELYSAVSSNEINFVGISLSRIFFTQCDKNTNKCEYITVSLSNKNDKKFFMDSSNNGEIFNVSMEGGYLYYYQIRDDATIDLIRQKFGSEKKVILLEDCTLTDYPVVYNNRLYYTGYDGGKISACELNMNSMDKKVMVSMYDADKSSTAGVGYGYYYVFLFGKPTSSSAVQYRGSSIYTSSSDKNTLKFSGGGWKY